MRKNLNRTDGLIRAILGILGIVLFFLEVFQSDKIEMITGIIGVILLFSAIIEFCPFYYFFGIKTRQKHKRKFY
ncbi:YgaP family membrane protein [Flavobacterium soli]|uniref:YgaP family membrane protein n=1 Tax=Flavobacterium soli TaxID=344881 RepID=UPI000417D101